MPIPRSKSELEPGNPRWNCGSVASPWRLSHSPSIAQPDRDDSRASRGPTRRYAAHGCPMSSREPVHPEELLLLDYVIGQLPDETRDQIKRHVAGCRACRRTIDDLILTVDELDRLPTMAIPHDSPAELAAARTRPRSRIRFFVPALAIVLFALLALVTLGGSRGGTEAAADADVLDRRPRRRHRPRSQRLLPLEIAPLRVRAAAAATTRAGPAGADPSIVQDLRGYAAVDPGHDEDLPRVDRRRRHPQRPRPADQAR